MRATTMASEFAQHCRILMLSFGFLHD
jgi:hypothetical protein